MKILYCNVGDMENYNGLSNDHIQGGGGYIEKNNVGHEVNNFTNHEGMYYGFVQSNNNTIDISAHFGCSKDAEFADEILVVWVVGKKYVVGYYKNARVFRRLHFTPDEITKNRQFNDYNITTQNAVIIPKEERVFQIDYPSRINIWYGNDNTNERVIDYINKYDNNVSERIRKTDESLENLKGSEKEAIVKIRENQGVFRNKMLQKYNNKCCLCGVNMKEMLIASHIKPWSKSDENEKLSSDNGLLLCPTHDKLFDLGLISFDEKGKILISSSISESNIAEMNINHNMKLDSQITSKAMLFFLKYHRDRIYKE